jgi:glutamyl-tRNA reductase
VLFCLSVSHKKTSLPMLESLALSHEDRVARKFCLTCQLSECIVLQTCHRIEVYGVAKDSVRESIVSRVVKSWSAQVGVSYDVLSKTADCYEGGETLAHLFSLAAGLESMVIGEDQILGQVRTAYVKAKKAGSVGQVLDKVFMKSVNIGRKVRTETRVNEGSVSVSSAAVDLAARELGSLSAVKALVIGAGEAGSIAAEALRRRRVKSILIANRSREKGASLAMKVGGKAIGLDAIYQAIPTTDLIIAAVTVNKPILEAARVRDVFGKAASSKSLYMIDISQPRSMEEEISSIPGVVLRDIDSLKGIVEENMGKRHVEAEKARRIVDEELERFERELSWVLVMPLVSKIYRSLDGVRRREFERAVRKMGESDAKKIMIMDRFSKELVERIMRVPTEKLKKAALSNQNVLLGAAEKLFGTETEGGEENEQV